MDPAVLVTEVTVPARGPPGWPSVAAWACLEKSSRRKRIPAAAIASCAARRATRRASGCGIDSSHPGDRAAHSSCPEAIKAPDKPCVTIEDEAICPVATVHLGD
jgi:hypothetical protein